MFGTPSLPLTKCNLNPLEQVWIIKPYGANKVRWACDRSPRQKGSTTLGNTYADIYWVVILTIILCLGITYYI